MCVCQSRADENVAEGRRHGSADAGYYSPPPQQLRSYRPLHSRRLGCSSLPGEDSKANSLDDSWTFSLQHAGEPRRSRRLACSFPKRAFVPEATSLDVTTAFGKSQQNTGAWRSCSRCGRGAVICCMVFFSGREMAIST